LTAYALGELPPEEAALVEGWLAEEPRLGEEVEEVRATAALLEGGFAEEGTAVGLRSFQRALIEARAGRRRRFFSVRVGNLAAMAVAAGVVAAVGVWIGWGADGEERSPSGTDVESARVDGIDFLGGVEGMAYLGEESGGFLVGADEVQWSDLDDLVQELTRPDPADEHIGGRVKIIYRYEDMGFDLDEEVIANVEVEGLEWPPLAISPSWYVPDDLPAPGTEAYQHLVENTFRDPRVFPFSTFSIDVDSAGYANLRRFLAQGRLPPRDAVRVEEMINYFHYDYPLPEGEHPLAIDVEVGACPWNRDARLLRVGLQGIPPAEEGRQPANLVFLLDVSGSMKAAAKLPLLKDALRLLIANLTEEDSVAIVTYSDQARVHLPPVRGSERAVLREAIDRLSAHGSTNGESGLGLAYRLASERFLEEGINRVLLATDGDFNVGASSEGALEELIAEKARSGVHLTVLGFGSGNLKDSKLEVLSGRGDGNYAYIDGLREAQRVLVDELAGTLETIAEDVKLQIDFNRAQVAAYRLIGYENRALAAQDFQDDQKDAGELGAGHRVTALYELLPAAGGVVPGVSPSKYAAPEREVIPTDGELCEVRVRYQAPGGSASRELRVPVVDAGLAFEELSRDTRFAAAVAAFGTLLRGSPHRGTADPETISRWALEALGEDRDGRRAEFCDLVRRAVELGLR